MSPIQLISKVVLLLFCFLKDGDALKIVNFTVPSAALLHSPVILDCDYSLELGSAEGLVLKYFFGDYELVYQWIMGRKPQALGLLKDRLDLNYKASNEENKMYRGVKILNATLELTGDYSCAVSTFIDEARMTKKMTVYIPASTFEFTQEETEKEMILKCTASGVYPQPEFNITWSDESKSFLVSSDVASYNSSSTMQAELSFQKNELTSRTSFYCNLNIPDTDYILKKVITIPSGIFSTMIPQTRRTTITTSTDNHVTAPEHYDPEIFFIREDSSSHRSSQAAMFFVFLSCVLAVWL